MAYEYASVGFARRAEKKAVILVAGKKKREGQPNRPRTSRRTGDNRFPLLLSDT